MSPDAEDNCSADQRNHPNQYRLQRLLGAVIDTGLYEAGGRHEVQNGESGKKSQRYGRVDQPFTLLQSTNETRTGSILQHSAIVGVRTTGLDPIRPFASVGFQVLEPPSLELLEPTPSRYPSSNRCRPLCASVPNGDDHFTSQG
jgi:hypothetical protein